MVQVTLKPGTLTWCREHHRCYRCGQPAHKTEPGSLAPYCDRCHEKHARKWANKGDG